MTHRIGIIGLGTVGARFVEQFNAHDHFDLVAAWDPDAAACAAHADAVAIVDGADAVIAAADAVYIAVPPLFHREYVEACVAAQTAVFCEKPLGVDVDESRELVALVEESGLPAGVNFVFSAAPAAVRFVDMVNSGELGATVRADLRLHFAEWPRAWHAKAQWLRLRDQGGWMREVVSHFVFLATRALGPLTIEAAHAEYDDGPDGTLCETSATAHLRSADGVELTIIGTSGGAGADVNDLTIRGAARSVRLWDWYRLQTTSGDEWVDAQPADRARLGAEAYAAQLGELSKLLAGETSAIATFSEALAVQELIEAVLTGS
jgi:predicted dehydrogenase